MLNMHNVFDVKNSTENYKLKTTSFLGKSQDDNISKEKSYAQKTQNTDKKEPVPVFYYNYKNTTYKMPGQRLYGLYQDTYNVSREAQDIRSNLNMLV